ncbi:M28 family metallopeptidase [Ferruginibacter yonginensis]|uniref:M28 family metallopeptidase n=1 Tax=Ferruginibacter yonginensis TaxID=1310416 RepID=A0ABV8QSI1_9BACT
MLKKIAVVAIICWSHFNASSQNINQLITATEAKRIESYLASDELKGRKTGTKEIDMAANFIAAEFKKSGLKPLGNLSGYLQSFNNIRTKFINANGTADGATIETANIVAITTDSIININEKSGYVVKTINENDNLLAVATDIYQTKKNSIVFVNTAFAKDFNRLKRIKRDGFSIDYNTVFVLLNTVPTSFQFTINNQVTANVLTNVVGVLPGKSKKNEYVVFSAHYDHLGIGKANAAGDSIYNGANDDAAGTTAVIMLAQYFSKIKNNERTIIFVAFTAEEIGGFGSQYFSKQVNPNEVVAMFNLEMIGTESKWGKNSAYITGFEKSDLGTILQKNLAGTAFKFEPDPYPSQNLFYRSDNATLAALGVPAHTISTSKMDIEPNYHKQSDDVASLDLDNMTEVIKAIALSSVSIINGKDTPSRVALKN